MTTLFPFESKCPSCGKTYNYLEVMSCYIGCQEDIDEIKTLMNHQVKCECGEIFDYGKNKIIYTPLSSEEYNQYLKSTIDGFQMTDEIIEKACNKIKELIDLRVSRNKRKDE